MPDDEIVIGKNLAWTIGGSLIVTGLWVGVQVAGLNSSVDELTRRALDNMATAVQVEARVRVLESESVRYDTRIGTLAATMLEVRADLRGIVNIMRADDRSRSINERILPGEKR